MDIKTLRDPYGGERRGNDASKRLERLTTTRNRAVSEANHAHRYLERTSKAITKAQEDYTTSINKGKAKSEATRISRKFQKAGGVHRTSKGWTANEKAKSKLKNETSRKVKAYNTKYKVKTFVKNLFKKKG